MPGPAQHRRVDQARGDDVHGDAVRTDLEGEGLGEADHAGLGGGVVATGSGRRAGRRPTRG